MSTLRRLKKYPKWGDMLGKSIFFCHNPESCRMIAKCSPVFKNGEDDILL